MCASFLMMNDLELNFTREFRTTQRIELTTLSMRGIRSNHVPRRTTNAMNKLGNSNYFCNSNDDTNKSNVLIFVYILDCTIVYICNSKSSCSMNGQLSGGSWTQTSA